MFLFLFFPFSSLFLCFNDLFTHFFLATFLSLWATILLVISNRREEMETAEVGREVVAVANVEIQQTIGQVAHLVWGASTAYLMTWKGCAFPSV